MRSPGKAQTRLNELSGAARNRWNEYACSLRKDRNEYLFDKGMFEWLEDNVKDVHYLRALRNHLRDIKYSASKKEAHQLQEGLNKFMASNHKDNSTNPNFQEAKRLTIKDLIKGGKVKMMRYAPKSHADSLTKTDTHAGFCYILTGKKQKAEYNEDELQEMYDSAVEEAKRDGTFGLPILIAYRTQGSGGVDEEGSFTGRETRKWKTRFVSIVDFIMILAENQFATPFQECLRNSGFYAGAYNDIEINDILNRARRRHSSWISIDYSSYDQTVSDWMMYEAFDVIRQCFDDEGFDEELWNIIKKDFIHKCFQGLDGKLYASNKGIPSGSRFTQIMGTIVNRLMILTYMLAKGFTDPRRFPMLIMGDDNIFFIHEQIDAKDLASYLRHNFGVIAHPDKCVQGTRWNPPHFLSRDWTYEGADRPVWELFAKLLYPERWRDYVTKLNGYSNLTREDIIYSYCLSFPVAMRKMLKDAEQFKADYRSKGRHALEGRVAVTGLDRLRWIENLGENQAGKRSVLKHA